MKAALVILATVTLGTSALEAQDVAINKKSEKQKSAIHQMKKLKKLEGSVVSDKSKEAFAQDFPGSTASSWARGLNFDEVVFMKDGQRTTAYYDENAQLVGTTAPRNFSDLPKKGQDYINKHYPGYEKVAVILFDDNEMNETDMVLYNQQFADEDNYFVELKKDNKTIVVQCTMGGMVSYFSRI